MRTIATMLVLVSGIAGLAAAPAAFADGEACSASEKKTAEGALRKAEEAEKAGRNKDAYQTATSSIGEPACAANGYKRRDGLIERTSRKLGAEAEKAGQFGDAFTYFSAPHRHGRPDYPLDDADRVMLKHAKAKPEDFEAVSKAVGHFEKRGIQASLKETRTLAKAAGEKALEKETKAFAATGRDSRAALNDARRWFDLAAGPPRAQERAVQRGDALLAEGTPHSVELAFEYYQFAHSEEKLKNARMRAQKLGDEAARKGDQGLAARFYALSGDKTKAAAVEKQKEKTEAKRQQQFKKDQQSLEKELGL